MEGGTVRLLVVGDSGVGKTCLGSLLSGAPTNTPTWTVGCQVFYFPHFYKDAKYHVECIDVGGSDVYKTARKIFYEDFDGVIFVYDLSNLNSYQNLSKWVVECVGVNFSITHGKDTHSSMHTRQSLPSKFVQIRSDEMKVPALFVGNKKDRVAHNFVPPKYLVSESLLLSTTQTSNIGDIPDFKEFLDFVITSRFSGR